MKIVSNSTPLIGLASIGRFKLLHDFFGEIIIAEAVYEETVTHGREKGGAKKEVASAKWIQTQKVKDRLAVDIMLEEMDLGEVETIVLAKEISADYVLMDEKKGRRMLERLEIPKIGTIGILLRAKQEGVIKSLRPELEKLRQYGFSLDPSLFDEVIKQAGE